MNFDKPQALSKLTVNWQFKKDESGPEQFRKDIEPKEFLTGPDFTLEVSYALGKNAVLNQGQKLTFKHSGQFQCTSCEKSVKKLFDGYCFPCLKSKASADQCVISPHKCHYLEGTCREPEWGEQFCYQPHFVYISHTDKFKVGITRQNQIPTRWIDQGATMASILAFVSSRHQAGTIEKLLTEIASDKSHWSKMLSAGNSHPTLEDFKARKNEIASFLKSHAAFKSGSLVVRTPEKLALNPDIALLETSPVVTIRYPLPAQMPPKITSINLEKSPELGGTLLGIKGQYLIFECGVFNVRRHEGFVTDLSLS